MCLHRCARFHDNLHLVVLLNFEAQEIVHMVGCGTICCVLLLVLMCAVCSAMPMVSSMPRPQTHAEYGWVRTWLFSLGHSTTSSDGSVWQSASAIGIGSQFCDHFQLNFGATIRGSPLRGAKWSAQAPRGWGKPRYHHFDSSLPSTCRLRSGRRTGRPPAPRAAGGSPCRRA